MTTTLATREEILETAVRRLVACSKRERAGEATNEQYNNFNKYYV